MSFFLLRKNASSGKIPREMEVAAVAEILGRVPPVFRALGCSLHINAETPGGIQNEDGGPLLCLFFHCRTLRHHFAMSQTFRDPIATIRQPPRNVHMLSEASVTFPQRRKQMAGVCEGRSYSTQGSQV